ncbi:PREDICTED: tripartite motif-containing protein 3-like [Branchiostoma belcheri]|uniref:RING-type E3 ubiquitin transferase n=1 Tax=Branchiostoma belcheri TaxID=7741 RepID=A0A6P4XAT4_BRABE|nr:PREDICTED: tripartite motif-containing protein 3-like [Branchiostoma belcheri]
MAAAPSSLGTHFKEELSCSICLELFTRPKVLPCGHIFCQDCLHDLASRQLPLLCPICRRQVRPPPQGFAGLPDSHIIASMCERLQQQATLFEETREQQPQSANRCSSHPSEVLKQFCKQCQIPICEQCFEEAHDDHLTTTIKKAAQERSSTVQALINEGRNILESHLSFIRSLREKEKTLNERKQQRDNSIIQAYNQMVQKLTQRKDHLLSESEENHTKNLDRIHTERDQVLADINELSAACDRAEQELQQGWVEFLSQQTALTEVVGKYRGKAAPTPVQTQPAVFQPTDTPVPVLGHVTVQSLPSAPIPEAPAARGTGHHHGKQRQGECQPQMVTFGGHGSGTGQFGRPWGVTVSEKGEIFVADWGNQRIQVFALQGTFVRQFTTVVSGDQDMRPNDVAMDGEGNLWVVGWIRSADHDFAVQYNKQGSVLRKFDLQKTGWGRGVTVDTRRYHILITQTTGDLGNWQGEVLVFRPDGTLVRTVGQQQGMKYPRYITVDGEGNILVSDWDNHCVYVYNEDGQFLFQFGGEGSGESQLNNPYGICTDRAGNIIVADGGNSRVEMFDKTGKFLKRITTDMERPCAVAMAIQGQLVVTDNSDDTPAVFQPTDTPVPVLGHVTVQSLPSAPIPEAPAARGTGHHHGNHRQGEHQPQKVTFGEKGSGTGQFNDPWGITVSDEGEVFVAGRGNQRIQVFTLQGTFIRQFPTVVSGEQEMRPNDVAMDGEGNLWVVGDTDSANFAVQYDKQGRVLREFDLQKTRWARGVAVDTRRNHILITQTTGGMGNLHGEVLVFRPDGTLVRTVGQLQGMKFSMYITVDGEGNILLSDISNHCVYVYNQDGQFLFQFGGEGSGEGQLKNPRGICTDRAGNIIVANTGNSRVDMFDKTGKFLKHITTGMRGPYAVAMATQGQLVVTDSAKNTVTLFQNF